ncbi:hypothetical protein MRB53_029498 [Persea americana]|uniref:Uncharacterized protein n=1 Tax=Persea americana TaxID=3435 RepID=A0ACC2KJ39_PERAE|nr:hypothetical protein MRB53_029498 [Persea americana]
MSVSFLDATVQLMMSTSIKSMSHSSRSHRFISKKLSHVHGWGSACCFDVLLQMGCSCPNPKITIPRLRAALFHPSALILGPQSHALGFGKTNGSRSFQTSREIRRLLDVLLSRTHGVMQEKLQSNKPPQIPSTQSWFLKACFCAPSPITTSSVFFVIASSLPIYPSL